VIKGGKKKNFKEQQNKFPSSLIPSQPVNIVKSLVKHYCQPKLLLQICAEKRRIVLCSKSIVGGTSSTSRKVRIKTVAPAGNRTRVCTVAGYYSTTRPLVLLTISIIDFLMTVLLIKFFTIQ
jgi:hypothetical protein